MADVEELLDGVPVRLESARVVRARGERRRARRRTGVAVVAVSAATAVGLGVWTQLSGDQDGSRVAAQGPNPFTDSRGVMQAPDPSSLPMNGSLHWTVDEKSSSSNQLPRMGLGNVCPSWRGDEDSLHYSMGTGLYKGKDGARARYRVVHFSERDDVGTALRDIDRTLRDCGLSKRADGLYSGRTGDGGPMLRVSVRQWNDWLGIIETQYAQR
ncbi:hypothetical protein [Streptomyces sp. NPDC051776]|uniref:hypothetical protein n=1 Tax=Streptomyces sp. NPDC051776 TaxID=3155414 RepID=UPI003415B369